MIDVLGPEKRRRRTTQEKTRREVLLLWLPENRSFLPLNLLPP